jgi:hypothetical protein
MLCCICQEQRDPAGGVVDTHSGKVLVCAECVERLRKQIEKTFPSRSLQLLRATIDSIAQDAVRALGLAKLSSIVDAE